MMKRINNVVKLIILVFLWLVLTGVSVFAQQTMNENQVHNAYDVSGVKVVRVNSERPVHVSIVGSNNDSLQIDRLSVREVHVTYSVSRENGALILTFQNTANQKQKTSREERETWIDHLLNGEWKRGYYHGSRRDEFQVTLPRDLSLDLNTKDSYMGIHRLSGSVTASGSNNHFEIDSLGSDLKIDGGDQQITGNGIGGAAAIDNHDGSVNLRSVNGPVSVNSDNSHIDLEDIRDSVHVSVNDGSVDLRNIRGNVTLGGGNSGFDLNDLHGLVKLEGSDNHVNASDIQGFNFNGSDTWLSVDHVNGIEGVTVKNSDGTVKLDEIDGPVTLKGTNLTVTLNYIHAAALLELDDSYVTGYKLMGNVSLSGSDTPIRMNEYQGLRFTADSGSGSINLTMSGRADSISIKRRSGDVTIRMLESYNGSYHLVTRKGHISWMGKQGTQILRNSNVMEISGGNSNQGYIDIELDSGDIRIN